MGCDTSLFSLFEISTPYPFFIFYPRVLAMISTVHLVIFTIILGLNVILRTLTNRGTNLPPGPKGKFLIGNLFDLPSPGAQKWLYWMKHKDLFGTLSSSSDSCLTIRAYTSF